MALSSVSVIGKRRYGWRARQNLIGFLLIQLRFGRLALMKT